MNHEEREKAIRVFKCSFALSIHLLFVYIFLFFLIHERGVGGRRLVCVLKIGQFPRLYSFFVCTNSGIRACGKL